MNQPFDTKCAQLDDLLGVGRSFDMVSRELYVGGRRAKMWAVNGYAKDMLLERAVEKLQEVETLDGISGVDELLRRYITVCDAGTSRDRMQAVTDVFAGKTLLIIDGFSGGILLDAKTFPTRSVQEPDAGKVLRGSHDGFVESIMENAALLRRRIRDPALTLERVRVSRRSQCDVALCYLEGRADRKLLSQLREKLRSAPIRSVAMSQETIAEAIAPRQWYNPFPKTRYTERPDVATASLMEGNILLLIDNTPAVMLLPVSLLRFNEEINDYYFPPLVGTYLRIILPLSKPALAVCGVLCAAKCWNMIEQPLLFLKNASLYPLSLYIHEMMNAGQAEFLSTCVLAAVPVLLLFLIFNDDLMDGLMQMEL